MGIRRTSPGKFQVFSTTGVGAGYKLYTYENGTTTDKATYSDEAGTTPNANPVVFDSRGEADIWFNGIYSLKLTDADDVLIWTLDDFNDNNDVYAENGIQDDATGVIITINDTSVVINNGDSGATESTNADEFVIESSGSGGMSILVPDDQNANIYFGSPSDNKGAEIAWAHDNNTFTIGTSKSGAGITVRTGDQNTILNLDDNGIAVTPEGAISGPNYHAQFHANNSGGVHAQWTNTTTGSGSTNGMRVGIESDEAAVIWNYENTVLKLGTNNATALTIDTNGYLQLNQDVIYRDDTTSNLYISGGSAFNLGANCILYAETHGSLPNHILFRGSSTEYARFDGSGQFGIGKTPTREFEVYGSGNVYAKIDADAGSDVAIEFSENNSVQFTLRHDASDNTIRLAAGGGTVDTGLQLDGSDNATIFGDFTVVGTTQVLTVGDGTVAGPNLKLNGTSVGFPYIEFQQNGTQKAFIQWSHANTELQLDSDNNISLRPGNAEAARIEAASTLASGETSLWLYDADNATLEQVTVGAADSGGSGFKVLRIPN